LARKSALSAKIKDNEVIVLENVSFDAPKTKDFVSMMSGLKIADKKTLLILSEPNKNVYLSARNLQNAKVITSSDVNTYAILDSACLLITEGALANIENNLKD